VNITSVYQLVKQGKALNTASRAGLESESRSINWFVALGTGGVSKDILHTYMYKSTELANEQNSALKRRFWAGAGHQYVVAAGDGRFVVGLLLASLQMTKQAQLVHSSSGQHNRPVSFCCGNAVHRDVTDAA
jgi:hypothetical protein